MRSGRIRLTSAILAFATIATIPSLAAPPRRGPTSPKNPTSKHNKAKFVAHQTGIDPARATELQTALIKADFSTSSPDRSTRYRSVSKAREGSAIGAPAGEKST